MCVCAHYAGFGAAAAAANAPPQTHAPSHSPPPAVRRQHTTQTNKSFNWCALTNGSSWCTASWNQHIPKYCGSCWAHATLSMLQDRLKVAKVLCGFERAR